MVDVVFRQPINADDRDTLQASPWEMFDGQTGRATHFSPNTSVFNCHYYSISIPY
jgi:hypothetical protein